MKDVGEREAQKRETNVDPGKQLRDAMDRVAQEQQTNATLRKQLRDVEEQEAQERETNTALRGQLSEVTERERQGRRAIKALEEEVKRMKEQAQLLAQLEDALRDSRRKDLIYGLRGPDAQLLIDSLDAVSYRVVAFLPCVF